MKKHVPDDILSVLPKWPNGINHDLGLGDGGHDGYVVPNVNDENPNFMTELELSLDFLQLLL